MRNSNNSIDVLVLADNSTDYLRIADYLIEKFTTLKISHCKSLPECLNLSEASAKYSVILLDLALQTSKKVELVERVQNTFKDTPIVILTGYTDLNLARTLLSKGVSDFLLKDEINPEILHKTVVYALERKGFITGLEISKNTYQNLFDFSPQPMWLYDNKSLRYLDVNEAAIRKYGYSKEEFLEMTIRDIRPKSHEVYLEKSLAERRHKKKSIYAGVFNHQLKSDETIQVEVYSRFFDYNSMNATLVLANDISEKLHYLNVIENQNERLREITWTLSHVTRAPLARLMGLVSLLEEDMNANENNDVNFLLKQVKLSANELDDIVRKLVQESQTIELINE